MSSSRGGQINLVLPYGGQIKIVLPRRGQINFVLPRGEQVKNSALQKPLQLEITQHKFGSLDSESGDHKQNKYVAKFALSHQCAGAETESDGSQAQQLQ